jgi:hypothetical protein
LYTLRIEHPRIYARWHADFVKQGFYYRGTQQSSSRKSPAVVEPEAIEIALKVTGGDAYKAARILGCSKTPVRNYIVAERAKGRKIGKRRAESMAA